MAEFPGNAPGTALRGILRERESLARHTSWRVGGPADRYYEPADLEDLAMFLAQCRSDEPIAMIGLGSNLLVRDGGVRGTVIGLSQRLASLKLMNPTLIRAEAGVASAKLARFSVNHGLIGAEFLSGVPGTIGGALAMNAGCHGSETWEIIAAVETVDRQGRIHTRSPKEYEIAYRHVAGPADEWFVAAHFRLQTGSVDAGRERIRELLARRGATQPTQLPNAGSVFRNPPGDFAARLIESAGMKGTCEGAACISTLHANFIVNQGGARAADIERLIARARERVRDVHGIALEAEVRVIGEPA
jgi:UDP-N-acetylmuramate dehydrogenase